MSVVIAVIKKENMSIQTTDIFNLRKKLVVMLIGSQCFYLNAFTGLNAIAETSTKQSGQSVLSTKHALARESKDSFSPKNNCRTASNSNVTSSAPSIKQRTSSTRQGVTSTAVNLRRAYHVAPMANQAFLRQQQWWAKEYRRRQLAQRLKNWQVRKEAEAFARHMADPRSPESIAYRNAALHAQSLQSKLPSEERTKILLHPNMTQARGPSQVYAALSKQVPAKAK